MQKKKKDNFLDKIVKKNYNNELEEVLEKKDFEENVKNLLLSILYKIETAYKDYITVKRDVESKEEFIENIISIVKEECDTIKIIKPRTDENELNGKSFIINKEKKEILCLPIERKLLYCLAKINKKDRIMKEKYFLIDRTVSNMINIGNNINTVEPLRDFNGWSWATMAREIESIEYNLIYQNLRILVGSSFLNQWVSNEEYIIDYMEMFENELENKYGRKQAEQIIELLKKLSILMEMKVKPEVKKQLNEIKIDIQKQLRKFEDKKKFIQELTEEKRELTEQIRKIDTILNNRDLLQQEYINRNNELSLDKKIFSIRILSEIMIRERENVFKKLENCNQLLKPQSYVERKKDLESQLKYLILTDVEDEEKEINELLICYQKQALTCFNKRIQKAETRTQILDLIYQFRYLCLVPFDNINNVIEIRQLKKSIQKTGELLIEKAIGFKLMIEFSKLPEINYKIIQNIFKVRIISLEELYFKITKEKDDWVIQLFDENIFEEKMQLSKDEINKKDLEIRVNKKAKLFM